MKLVLTARFFTDGDFCFDHGEDMIDPKSKLYEAANVEYRYTHCGEEENFFLSTDGSDRGRLAARDLLQGMICGLRTFKSYVVGDIYEMLNPLLENEVFDRSKDISCSKTLSGNYDGTVINLDIIRESEDRVRTRLEIEMEYKTLLQDHTLVATEHGCHEYANQKRRNELLDEYRSTLSDKEQLAVYLHGHLCHSDHTAGCTWSYEIDGLHDDWEGHVHKKYLKMAKDMLEKCPDIELIKSIILTMSESM